MKRFVIALLALACCAAPLVAQVPSALGRLEGLRVLETPLPLFPQHLLTLGVREGEVRLAIAVDKNGRLEDALAVAYTHPDFARSALEAVKRWIFEPARFKGEPIAAASEVAINFQVEGTVVISLTAVDSLNIRLNRLFTQNADAFRPRTLSELDRIPTPIAAPSPPTPARFLRPAARNGQVTVTFYIDETGAVRMPSVNEDQDGELAASALTALRNWKFEPPTCRGKPVLVRASQRFNFSPASTAATTPTP